MSFLSLRFWKRGLAAVATVAFLTMGCQQEPEPEDHLEDAADSAADAIESLGEAAEQAGEEVEQDLQNSMEEFQQQLEDAAPDDNAGAAY